MIWYLKISWRYNDCGRGVGRWRARWGFAKRLPRALSTYRKRGI